MSHFKATRVTAAVRQMTLEGMFGGSFRDQFGGRFRSRFGGHGLSGLGMSFDVVLWQLTMG